MSQESSPFPTADRAAIECQILNTMRPASVSRVGKNWKIGGLHFESELKNRANAREPWSYTENGRKIGFAFDEIRWSDGTVIKKGVNASVGVINTKSSPVSLTYPDALGAGIDVKIIQDNYRWQKIVEIESLASLGEIPADAEYLEISFKVSGDFALPDGVIDDRIPFGEDSFLQPVRAWDSSGDLNNKSGAIGVVNENVITKKIPVAWLKEANYPIKTDLTITYGAENAFRDGAFYTSPLFISVAALDSSHFVVAYYYRTTGLARRAAARIGVISGTTISSYGAENVFRGSDIYSISVAALDSTHFVVTYSAYSGYPGIARIGLVSGTTISSYGAENVFNSALTRSTSVAALDSTHFVVGYKDDGGDDYGCAKVGIVSGTTISSYGAENVFNSAITNYISVAALDSTHFVIAYQDVGNSSYGTAIVGLVSGTTISSYGAENVFNSATTNYISVAALDSTHFVVGYKDDGGDDYGIAIVGEFVEVTFIPQIIIT